MLKVLEEMLEAALMKVRSGNCNISDKQIQNLITVMQPYLLYDPYTTAYKAYTYLGICPKTFYNLIKEGELPKGIKVSGDSSLKWLKTDIENYSKKTGKINKLGFTLD